MDNTQSPLEWALDLASRGWYVFPCFTMMQQPDGTWKCDCPDTYKQRDKCTPGKHPRTLHGSDDASIDEAVIRRWWGMFPTANVAVELSKSRLVTVAPDSPQWHAEFIASGLPPTFTFLSGGGDGHQHWFYRLPDGVPQYRLCRQGEYDIMSAGYAIVPPSNHHSGRQYRLLDDLPAAVAPNWVCGRLIEAASRPKGKVEFRGHVFSDEEINRLVAQMDPDVWNGVRYGDRSTSLVAIAGDLAKLGANAPTIVAVVQERDITLGFHKYANRRTAEKSYVDLARRALHDNPPSIPVGSVGKSHSNPDLKQPGTGTESVESYKLPLWPNPELADRVAVDTAWYVQGLVGPGLLTELDGWAKLSGKTTFTLALVRALLAGDPFLGLDTVPTRVVYLTEQTWQSLLPNIRRAGLGAVDGLYWAFYNEAYGVPWARIINSAIEQAVETGAGLLVIDTLAQWSGLKGDIENNSGTAYQILTALEPARSAGLAVLILRHDKKAGGEVTLSARGSSAYAAVMDVVLHLEPLQDEAASPRQRMLTGSGRFMDVTPPSVVIELSADEPLTYEALGDPSQVFVANAESRVWGVLPAEEAFAVETDQIVELSGVRRQDALKALHTMLLDTRISRKGKGVRGNPYKFWRRTFEVSDD